MVRVKRTELDGSEVEMEFATPEEYEAYRARARAEAEKAEADREASLKKECEKAKADVKKIASGIEALIVEARDLGIGPDDLVALFLAKTLSCCR